MDVDDNQVDPSTDRAQPQLEVESYSKANLLNLTNSNAVPSPFLSSSSQKLNTSKNPKSKTIMSNTKKESPFVNLNFTIRDDASINQYDNAKFQMNKAELELNE